ncbi:hypothetical protein BX616_000485 [Lobosporangium transversale]|nr:hypothetical protein BX616_000485 [Lobosporangium transversale]
MAQEYDPRIHHVRQPGNHSNNPYNHFQDGHVPAYTDNSDWNRHRDPTRPSTESASSIQSWTSDTQSPIPKTNRPPPPYSLQQQPQQQQQQYRTESSSSTSSPVRYRNDHSLNGHRQQFAQGHITDHHTDVNSNHNSLMSQVSASSQPRTSQRAQRRRDPSAAPAAAGEEPKLRSLDDYEAMLQEMASPTLGPRGARESSRSTTSTRATPASASTSTSTSTPVTAEPSLDDFEAMLQEMASPTLGPRGQSNNPFRSAAAARRQQEREARTDRTSRQSQRQQQKQQQQQQQQQASQQQPRQPEQQQEQLEDPLPQPRARMPRNNNTPGESFEDRRLKRRSSLPGRLKTEPNLFLNLQRRGSGSSLHPLTSPRHNNAPGSFDGPSLITEDMPPLLPYREIPQPPPPFEAQNAHHLPPSQEKRFSWENESVAPREDLLRSGHRRPQRPGSDERSASVQQQQQQQRKGSWQDMTFPGEDGQNPNRQRPQRLSQQGTNRATASTRSHLSVEHQRQADHGVTQSHSPVPSSRRGSNNNIKVEVNTSLPHPLSHHHPNRPTTPNSNPRSRPSTPLGGIKPPPGPAPASASVAGAAAINSRRVSPRSATGKRSNSNDLLLPFSQGGTRPRAGSSASINNIVLDRTLTPPPPSSPLPSLPPSAASNESSPGVHGLGIDSQTQTRTRGRKGSVGTKDQGSTRQRDGQKSSELPTPTPSSSISPELGAQTTTTTTTTSARLRRENRLEKNGSGLQNQFDPLAIEHDIEKKLQQMFSPPLSSSPSGPSSSSAFAEGVRTFNIPMSPASLKHLSEADRASIQSFHDQELNRAVKQVQEEKESIIGAMKEREERSRSEMSAQIETLRAELATKESELVQLRSQLELTKNEQMQGYSTLDQQVQKLLVEKQEYQEQRTKMEREMETFQERLQQEAVQYRTLQDSVQRLGSKMARLESQHAVELQKIHMDHDRVLEKMMAVQDHEDVITQLTAQHQKEMEERIEQLRQSIRQEMEASVEQGQQEAKARDRVLREKLEQEKLLNQELEEQVFKLQRALEDKDEIVERLERASRSVERQTSIYQLREQENQDRIEELERQNSKWQRLLKDLDSAAVLASNLDADKDGDHESKDDQEKEKEKVSRVVETFEQQQRKWTEQAELMAKKLTRAEEEARRIEEENERLRVALEMQSRQSSSSRSSSRMQSQLQYQQHFPEHDDDHEHRHLYRRDYQPQPDYETYSSRANTPSTSSIASSRTSSPLPSSP